MTAIFHYIFKCIFLHEHFQIMIQISRRSVANLHSIGSDSDVAPNKPLSEPMLAQFTDAYMRHSA